MLRLSSPSLMRMMIFRVLPGSALSFSWQVRKMLSSSLVPPPGRMRRIDPRQQLGIVGKVLDQLNGRVECDQQSLVLLRGLTVW